MSGCGRRGQPAHLQIHGQQAEVQGAATSRWCMIQVGGARFEAARVQSQGFHAPMNLCTPSQADQPNLLACLTGVASSMWSPPPSQCARRTAPAAAAPAGQEAGSGSSKVHVRFNAWCMDGGTQRDAQQSGGARSNKPKQNVCLPKPRLWCLQLCTHPAEGHSRAVDPNPRNISSCLEHITSAGIGAHVQHDLEEAGHPLVKRLGHLFGEQGKERYVRF